MKKKLFALVMVICVMAAMGLTGCGSDNPYKDLNFEEYIELPEYTGLEREEISVSVSDEEVQAQIDVMLEESAEPVQITEGKVQEGDAVNIDYVGKLEGVAFEGGSAKGYDLVIGSGTFIDGFEDGLIGKEIGGTYDLELTFPEDYSSAELAGQNVIFTVTVNHVTVYETPEYTADWVKANSDVDTKEDFEALIRDQLVADKEETEKNNIMSMLWNEVVDSTKVTVYPEDLVKDYVEEIEAQYQATADMYGVTVEDLWALYEFESEEDYDAANEQAAQIYTKEQMVMYYIAELEGLEYTEDEATELRDAIEQAGYDDETFKVDYGQDIESYIDSALTFEKVVEFIYDNSVVK